MSKVDLETFQCPVCGKLRRATSRRLAAALPDSLRRQLEHAHPEWTPNEDLCSTCAADAKMEHLRSMMPDPTLSADETEVLESIRADTIVTSDGEEDFEAEDRSEPLVLRLASTFGSWPFLGAVVTFLVVWTVVNLAGRPFDPYPVIVFAVTSAVLATIAALQGPIIIMSQRQQRERDRRRARADYRINLKAELEIQYLDEKVDQLLRSHYELRDELARLRGDAPETSP